MVVGIGFNEVEDTPIPQAEDDNKNLEGQVVEPSDDDEEHNTGNHNTEGNKDYDDGQPDPAEPTNKPIPTVHTKSGRQVFQNRFLHFVNQVLLLQPL